MTFQEFLNQTIERWKGAFGQYNELRARAEPAVVKWEWSLGERYDLRPFFFNRYPRRARAIRQPPASRRKYIEYGLDAEERPQLRRLYGYQGLPFETFYSYSDDLVEIIRYLPPLHIPLEVQQLFYEAGLLLHYAQFGLNDYASLYDQKDKEPEALYQWIGPNGYFKVVERYLYEANRLVKILVYREVPGVIAYESEERFIYTKAGKLRQIDS
jgi:hypothetical protein